jgi:hypothetical protein
MTPRQLIEQAVKLIAADRKIAVDSFSDARGVVRDVYDRRIIADYDRFLKPARRYLRGSRRAT